MIKARLHWFWRVLVAILAGFAIGILINFSLYRLLAPATFGNLNIFIPLSLLRLAIPVAIYAWLTHYYGPVLEDDGQIHCRKCNYILRGITEPRCPECGERI